MINVLDLGIFADHWGESSSRSSRSSDSDTPAGCALDMNYATSYYDDEISSKDIDSTVIAEKGAEIVAAVVAQNVTNLDTYQLLITFDPDRMMFIEAYEDSPDGEVQNFLKKNSGETLGFQAVEQIPGTINIANALAGRDTGKAPDGSGIIAFLKFKILDNASNNWLKFHSVNYLNSDGVDRTPDSLMDAVVNPMSCDDDLVGTVSLKDAILILQTLTGLEQGTGISDINGDGIIGIADVVSILRAVVCENM
ncbi:cohesin domain-containing protein [Desulfonema magnum]|uniref:Cohesin domain-containing protein n=1 Tax=Desulfonema magnum TaxID=45655 RepID=A0A975BJP7_9BACT|nr:cohesin domain-containing protein [Desulfonema magnum]QTA86944.1 Cohesin domain-containing protein [Desulfonema magnum]